MANPSEEPLMCDCRYHYDKTRGCTCTCPEHGSKREQEQVRLTISDLNDQVSTLLNLTERQRVLLSNAEAVNAEAMLENANLRLTIEDQSEEIAKCKVLKYEAVLDDMEEFCLLYDGAADDDPVKCGWRTAILRMREIRNG